MLFMLVLLLATLALAIPRNIEWELHQLVKRGGKCSFTTQSRVNAGVKGIDKSIAYTKQEGYALNKIDSAERAARSKKVSLNGIKKYEKRGTSIFEPDVVDTRILARAMLDLVDDDAIDHENDHILPILPRGHSSTTGHTLTTGTGHYGGFPNKEIQTKTNNLKTTYGKAVNQRIANQHTLPSTNPAQKDLKTYAKAQEGAGKRISSLTGVYSKDVNTIKALRKGFAGGTSLNEKARTDVSFTSWQILCSLLSTRNAGSLAMQA
jgi:hypothetical protein